MHLSKTLLAIMLGAILLMSPVFAAFPMDWEAENLDPINGIDEDTYNNGASEHGYVLLNQTNSRVAPPAPSRITAWFRPKAGNYMVRIRVLAPKKDAAFFLVAGGGWTRLKAPGGGKWEWVEQLVYLPDVEHQCIVISPADPLRVDRIQIVPATTDERPLIGQPRVRQNVAAMPEPHEESIIDVNPPTFRWLGNWDQPYEIQYVKAGHGWQYATTIKGIRDTFYRPLQPLDPDRYQWRVRAKGDRWYGPISFVIPESTPKWPIEPWDKVFQRFPKAHPRIQMTPEDLATMREKAQGPMKWVSDRAVEHYQYQFTEKLELLNDKPKGKVNSFEEKVIRRVTAKKEARDLIKWVGKMALMGVVLDRDDYKKESIRRAMIATRLDPQGYTSHSVTDFGNAAIVNNLGRCYDLLYNELTVEQRTAIREAILARLFYYKPRMEQSPFGAHAWQHCFLDLCMGALAIYDESPEARDWLEWAARITVAFYPWFGGQDGGSAEGPSYFRGTNLATSLEIVLFWRKALGLDLTGNAWFENAPYFLMYSFPPNGPSSWLGDHGSGPGGPPDSGTATVMLVMGNYYDNPWAVDYAMRVKDVIGEDFFTERALRIRALTEIAWQNGPFENRRKSVADLPPGRLFGDVGVAFVHSDYGSERNVMLGFRSSGYGGFGHSHANQNAFNISAFGKPLIIDSGHYTSYHDNHHRNYTNQTKAHNTILVDGTGQPGPMRLEAYGRIVGFAQDKDWAWMAGDASKAYFEVPLERFTRQIVWVRGKDVQTYLIYDDIRAADGKPHRFDYLLHAVKQMEVDPKEMRVTVTNEDAQARIAWLLPDALEFAQTDAFDPPVKNWRPDRQDEKFPQQWHLTASASDLPSAKFLTVIRVGTPEALDKDKGVEKVGDMDLRVGSTTVAFTDEGMTIDKGFLHAPLRCAIEGAD